MLKEWHGSQLWDDDEADWHILATRQFIDSVIALGAPVA